MALKHLPLEGAETVIHVGLSEIIRLLGGAVIPPPQPPLDLKVQPIDREALQAIASVLTGVLAVQVRGVWG